MVKRWLVNIAVIVSSLLLMASIVLWVRSYWRLDEWSRADEGGRVWAGISFQGAVHWVRTPGKLAMRRGLSHDSQRVGAGKTWGDLHSQGIVMWSHAGVTRITVSPGAFAGAAYSPRVAAPLPAGVRGVGSPAAPGTAVRWSMVPWVMELPYEAVAVSYGWGVGVFGAAPAVWGWRVGRRVMRRRRGWCEECGYDLRASGEVCSECGAAVRRGKKEPRPVGARSDGRG